MLTLKGKKQNRKKTLSCPRPEDVIWHFSNSTNEILRRLSVLFRTKKKSFLMGRIVIYCINVNVFSGSVFRNNIFSGSCISSYSLIIHLVCSRTFSLYLLQNLDIYYFITYMDFFFFLPHCQHVSMTVV